MATETRQIDHRYFDIDDSTVGRTETQRGDFDSYDGYIRTTSEKWWIECDGHRAKASLQKLESLIRKSNLDNADALAAFFADSRRYGFVIAPNYTGAVDFTASFGRDSGTIFPRLNDRTLQFVTKKATSDDMPTTVEYWDIRVNLDTMRAETHCFWSGKSQDLTLTLPPDRGT